MCAPSVTLSIPASRKLLIAVAESTALTSVFLVVPPNNNAIMFAFRGSRKALRASALSAVFISGLSAFCLVAGCSADSESPQSTTQSSIQKPNRCTPFAKTQTVRVASVYDGDTLTLSDGRKVRLVGINAAEIGRDGQPDQPFSRLAQKEVSRFVHQARRIELLLDAQTKDHYGRWLGHLYNEAGENLEQYLLQQGLAYHVAIPPNLTLAKCLSKAEQRGRDAQLGVWNDSIPPVPAGQLNQGGFQRVQGRVTRVQTAKHWRLVLDNNITVILYSEHQHRFTKMWFEHLQGQYIEVQGWVYRSKGHWRIKLETPYGIEQL
tara:strand:- start:9090 stop:10049 length:960 start_codon:yes stop_codon:yes gene_type:complete